MKKILNLFLFTPVLAWSTCININGVEVEKLTGYVDTLNLHIMKDGSAMIGCMCH